MSELVQFNVGGNKYFTCRSTIFREPTSKLANLVQNTQPFADGSYFLDR